MEVGNYRFLRKPFFKFAPQRAFTCVCNRTCHNQPPTNPQTHPHATHQNANNTQPEHVSTAEHRMQKKKLPCATAQTNWQMTAPATETRSISPVRIARRTHQAGRRATVRREALQLRHCFGGPSGPLLLWALRKPRLQGLPGRRGGVPRGMKPWGFRSVRHSLPPGP